MKKAISSPVFVCFLTTTLLIVPVVTWADHDDFHTIQQLQLQLASLHQAFLSLFAVATPAQPARGTSTAATPATPEKKINPVIPSFPVSTPPISTQPVQQTTPAQPYLGMGQLVKPVQEMTPASPSQSTDRPGSVPPSEVVENISQQPQSETKEIIRNLRTQIGEVHGQLTQELQNKIQSLQTQVVELQSKQQVLGSQEVLRSVPNIALIRTLRRGSSGDDVKQLQEFLAKDKVVYPQGLATGFYGPATEAAVKRFQEKNGIEAIGVVGPKTRAVLSHLVSGDCASSTTRPCFDRVTPTKTFGFAASGGENAFLACMNSQSPSSRGFGQIITVLSESEQYQYCFEGSSTIQVRWFSGSASTTTESVPPFSTDTTPPVRFNEAPSGTLPAGTASVTISLSTDENATCKYSNKAAGGISYAEMENTFSNTNSTYHSSSVTIWQTLYTSYDLQYAYYVRCQDSAGNVNTDDYPILFSVAKTPVPTPEIVFAQLPDGTVGTPYSTKISVKSGEPPLTWSIAGGAFPTGLTLATVDGQGSVSGNPTAAGTFNFTAKVSDGNGSSDTENFGIIISSKKTNVRCEVEYNTNVPNDVKCDVNYNGQLASCTIPAASSGYHLCDPTPLITIAQPDLNTGFSPVPGLSGMFTGVNCTRTETVYNTTYYFATCYGPTALVPAPIASISITTTDLPAGAWGIPYYNVSSDGSIRGVTLSATGGVAPYQWQIVEGNFPNGLKFATTGQISQWPLVVPGTYTFTVSVTDSTGASAAKVLSIEVKSDQGGYWGGNQYDSHRFVRSVRFGFDRTKFTDVRAIRLYEKKPGETQFVLSGSFPLVSTACGTSVVTDLNWSLGFSCRIDYEAWTATSRLFDYGDVVPIGEYSYYAAIVDSAGVETVISDMLHQYALSSTRIVSPTSVLSPVVQPFSIQWTVPLIGWPAHWASTITAGYSIYVHEEVSKIQVYRSTVSVPISSQTGSKVYDGPILDPVKLYRVNAYYSYLGIDYANRARVNYLTMTENPTTFSVSP